MISVCMTSFNGSAFIKEQIDSILPQLEPGDELIISDDGSTDGTLAIIESYRDARIQLLHFGQKNLIKNFENALSKAAGEIIFLADQDDIWLPGKVQVCVAALEMGAELVVSDCKLIDKYGKVIGESLFSLNPPRDGVLANIYKNSFTGCCMAFRKSILLKALPFPSTIPMHDSWIGTVALAAGAPVVFIEDKLILYRRHEAALSSTGARSAAPLLKRFIDRWNLTARLTLRKLGLA